MNFPIFKLQQVVKREQQKPLLTTNIVKGDNKQGVQISQKAVGILQKSFICGIIGNPGSGKSTLIQELIFNPDFYGKRFQRVIFVGPTSYPKLIQDAFNTKKVLDLAWIYEQIRQANQWRCKTMLIVLDDVVATMKSLNNPDFVSLFFNRRHLLNEGNISFLVTSQKWNMVPTFIRGAYNMIIAFPMAKQQLQTFVRDVDIDIPKKTMAHLFNSLKKHHFYYINCQLKKLFTSQWAQI